MPPSYLDRIGAGLIIQDHEPLTYEFVPPELVGRDAHLGELATMFRGVSQAGISQQAVITGPVGSGKTAMAQRFMFDLRDHLAEQRPIVPVHVNCRTHPTRAQVLTRIVGALDGGHPERGFSASEVLQSIRRLLRGRSEHLLLVLDEVDHLLQRDGHDLLYQLLRLDEERSEQGTLSLLMISQTAVLDMLEPAVLSRLGRHRHLQLSSYDAAGLTAIATQRAELALVDGTASTAVLDLIGQAAAEAGDARLAIELLEGAAQRAEAAGRSEILAADVQRLSTRQPTTLPRDVIDELPEHGKMLLLAICRRLRREPEVNSGESEQLYHVVCEEYETSPRSHTTVWKLLKRLQDRGVLATRVDTAAEGRGRTQWMTMPSMLPADVQRTLERQLQRKRPRR